MCEHSGIARVGAYDVCIIFGDPSEIPQRIDACSWVSVHRLGKGPGQVRVIVRGSSHDPIGRRQVRLPEGDLAKARGDGTSKSAVSRRFVALSRKKMKAWLASDLSELDLLVIQIDGLHVGDHVLMAAIGVDGNGDKHVLAVVEGATENTVVVQAWIDNLLARGLDPTLPRLFIVDGAKALSKAIRNTFGVAAAIQRCQVHKGRNIIERLPQHLHASVKKALRQAWDQDDANKAERLLRNLVRRLEHEEPGVSGSILEGLEEILTVIRLGLPHELRRSLACTNIVENALGTVRSKE